MRECGRWDLWTIEVLVGCDPETGRKEYYSETVRGSKVEVQRRLRELLRGEGL